MAKDRVDIATFKSICEPKFVELSDGVLHLTTKVENGLTDKVRTAATLSLWSLLATLTFLGTTVGVWISLHGQIAELSETIIRHVE